MAHHHHTHAIRRIVLPSGRSIEVVRFDETPEISVRQLHICLACASELVQPHNWSEGTNGAWQMTLECPNCGWSESGTYAEVEIELLEERLDAGVEEMIDDLRRLTHANMAVEVDGFVAALRYDAILPEDF